MQIGGALCYSRVFAILEAVWVCVVSAASTLFSFPMYEKFPLFLLLLYFSFFRVLCVFIISLLLVAYIPLTGHTAAKL